ncbi:MULTISPECIES: hypothetical protein [Devosia]|uniref:Polyketide cyclase n=1 Tax=Devosia equisanguinis TaxID=2490941 RepID=A0A3S4CD36_9HYPH|nr:MULTISPECIES: hypothetical protein [Devosia]ODT48953.1 MAG: hypothetical protein ABS74_10685 [Pelagibacterium sp. SCN 63-126]ODU89346.1 MAG: hypothetical protein ABT14_00415 [Pelagibacterium sp. SCN 63-17]OJX44117.1 MAG: hypothetical protein BGO80_00525 [Devosia sp. 63-57]VDS04410.1 hypothetical protein DEVEQU_01545 [Devosia equisanguinis]
MFPSRTLSLAINRPYAEAYAFLSNPANILLWTDGVRDMQLRQASGYVWHSRYFGQDVQLTFTPPNALGVLDLAVAVEGRLPRVHHIRVFPNGKGTELCLTIIQTADESDDQFSSECEWLRTDLQVLKAYLDLP